MNVLDGELMKQHTLRRMKDFKWRNPKNCKLVLAHVASVEGHNDANDKDSQCTSSRCVDAMESAQAKDAAMATNVNKPSSVSVPP